MSYISEHCIYLLILSFMDFFFTSIFEIQLIGIFFDNPFLFQDWNLGQTSFGDDAMKQRIKGILIIFSVETFQKFSSCRIFIIDDDLYFTIFHRAVIVPVMLKYPRINFPFLCNVTNVFLHSFFQSFLSFSNIFFLTVFAIINFIR